MISDTSPEQPLDSSPRGQLPRRGGYINRFKFQRERLRQMQTYEDKYPRSYPVKKTLPKLLAPRLERDDTNLSSLSSKSIETIKLPTMPATGDSKVSQYIKNNPPVRTVHLRLYPDHFSRIGQSLPSLPSIAGSPGPVEANRSPDVSPNLDNQGSPPEEPPVKQVVIPPKHRYEVIAFQKTIHTDKRDANGNPLKFRKHILYHLDESPRKPSQEQDGKKQEEEVPALVVSAPAKHRRRCRNKSYHMKDARTEDAELHRKWKENCGCLRCQIIKRQWSEGDSLYKIWGEYPCHHVDPKALPEDDDD